MMKLVFEFTKTGNMIYISHLDLARLFLRVLRMSGLRPSYSHGFNPHPKMSLTLPLSLGMHSVCELLEFETEMVSDIKEIEAAITIANNRLPKGIRILRFWKKESDIAKSLASYANAAIYEIMCEGVENAPALLGSFFAMTSVMVAKRDKKSDSMIEKEVRGEMYDYRIVKDIPGRMLAEITLAAAPGRTLNPNVFLSAFCRASDLDSTGLNPYITRIAILDIHRRSLKEMLEF